MEKELRIIKNRGYFPIPAITPQGKRIKTTQDQDKVLEAVNEEVTEMIKAIKQSEENFEREQEQAKKRDEQLRLTRQTNRSGFNFLTLANSTTIRNDNARSDQPAIHFDGNTVLHFYPTTSTTTSNNQYEPPANDSIIQGAGSAPTCQVTTNTTHAIGHNDQWRYNNGTNTVTHMTSQGCTTRPTGHSFVHNNSPNSSDLGNGPTCFKCGEHRHRRIDCRVKVFYTHCRTQNHDTKGCRKHHNSAPSPTNSHITAGYHLMATPPPLMGTAATMQQAHQQWSIVPELIREQPAKNQHHNPHTIQWHITSTFSQHDGRPDTNHNPSCQQQQERRSQQADDEKHQDLQWQQQSRMHHLAQPSRSSNQVYQYTIS